MAFKMNRSAFNFGVNKPSEGYGSRPGERSGGRASERADRKIANVEKRRGDEGPAIKKLFGKSTEGERVGEEYRMGLADMRLFGGVGKKHLRASGLALEGDHEKHIKKNRRKRNRLKKQGKVDSWGDRV